MVTSEAVEVGPKVEKTQLKSLAFLAYRMYHCALEYLYSVQFRVLNKQS